MADGGQKRLVVGISGASGVLYGVRALDACRALGVESHLIVSRAAALTLAQETTLSLADLAAKADVAYRVGDIGAAVASGSFSALGMIIAPCSIRTMSEIATGKTWWTSRWAGRWTSSVCRGTWSGGGARTCPPSPAGATEHRDALGLRDPRARQAWSRGGVSQSAGRSRPARAHRRRAPT